VNPESPHKAALGKAANKIVLVIEDNPIDQKMIVHAFGKWSPSNEVTVTRDAVGALDYLLGEGCEERPVPALVLLALKLLHVDGLEVLRRIRAHERTRLLPVVILTSSRQDADLLHGYSLGANAYLRKPVLFADFVETARTLALFWLVLNQPPPGPSGSE
jgi:two-component system response regulator